MFVKAHQYTYDVYSRYTVSIVFLSSILSCLRLLFYTLLISVNSLDAALYPFSDRALSNIQNKVELVLKRRNINLLDRRLWVRGPKGILVFVVDENEKRAQGLFGDAWDHDS